MKNFFTISLFVLLFASMSFLEANHALGVYGIILLFYLLSKMGLSFAYKPFTGEVKDFKVAAVIPSYNEDGDGLIQTLESILAQTYPIDTIYIVDDGSPDPTGYEKVSHFVHNNPDRCQHVIVHRLDQNAGKRHAQAWAFSQSDADVFFTVDSDSYVYPTALEELIKTLNDDAVYAATGHLNARNRDENLLTRLIDIRYDNAFRVERAAQSVTGNILTCSGPLSIYRREVVIPNLHHYLNQYFLGVKMTMGDDRCLTNYANKLGKTVYQSTARCDTDVPNNIKTFMKQQIRWNKSFFRESLVAMRLGLKRPWVVFWSSLELVLFTLLSLTFVNVIFRNLKSLDLSYLLIVFLGIVFSALIRNIHYAVKHPLLFLLAPFYGILHMVLLQPIRFYALITLRDVRWGTRQANADASTPLLETGTDSIYADITGQTDWTSSVPPAIQASTALTPIERVRLTIKEEEGLATSPDGFISASLLSQYQLGSFSLRLNPQAAPSTSA